MSTHPRKSLVDVLNGTAREGRATSGSERNHNVKERRDGSVSILP
jgi:hypothetical protein